VFRKIQNDVTLKQGQKKEYPRLFKMQPFGKQSIFFCHDLKYNETLTKSLERYKMTTLKYEQNKECLK